jgi:peptide/nickel transport system substrate-binding protein
LRVLGRRPPSKLGVADSAFAKSMTAVRCWVALVALASCTPAPEPGRSGTASADTAPGSAKAIVIAQLNATKGYGPWEFAETGGGGSSLAEVHTAALVTEGTRGNLEPRLAARLPALEDESIVVLPDGRMRTTWSLRPDVKWHDGTPFTAEDILFGWDVAREPELVASITTSGLRQAESIEATDRLTVVITWSTTFYDALHLGHRQFWPFPRHLLGDAFQGDKQAFRLLPYFTTEYVHLGPFRLTDFGLGEQQVFERFDDYFLGRPRVNTLILRTITNANTLLANLKAGAVDVASEKTLPSEAAVQLYAEWQASGAGTVLDRQDNWVYAFFQFDPQWARPPEVSRDARLRRGLFQAIDREAIREAALPGLADANGDTFMQRSDPRSQIVGYPFARYRYDPARAVAELVESGWRRGADGQLLGLDGRQVQIELFGYDERWTREVALVADYWRRVGIDVIESIPSRALARDREIRSTFPGAAIRARASGEGVFDGFDGRLFATPQNRWQGGNNAHYANPALDRLIDTLYATLDEREQGRVLQQMGEIMATDLPALPIYFAITFAVVRQGIHALREDYAGIRDVGAMARNAHLWDRD